MEGLGGQSGTPTKATVRGQMLHEDLDQALPRGRVLDKLRPGLRVA